MSDTEYPVCLLRRPEVQRRTGLSRSQLYLLASQRRFPAPIALSGSRSVAWPSDEVSTWIEAQIRAGRKVAA